MNSHVSKWLNTLPAMIVTCVFLFASWLPLVLASYVVICYGLLRMTRIFDPPAEATEEQARNVPIDGIVFRLVVYLLIFELLIFVSWYLLSKKLGIL